MKKITETEAMTESKKSYIARFINMLGNIRPVGVFGFLLVIGAFYTYKYVQLGNF
jgi:hypothetical protein